MNIREAHPEVDDDVSPTHSERLIDSAIDKSNQVGNRVIEWV